MYKLVFRKKSYWKIGHYQNSHFYCLTLYLDIIYLKKINFFEHPVISLHPKKRTSPLVLDYAVLFNLTSVYNLLKGQHSDVHSVLSFLRAPLHNYWLFALTNIFICTVVLVSLVGIFCFEFKTTSFLIIFYSAWLHSVMLQSNFIYLAYWRLPIVLIMTRIESLWTRASGKMT